MKTSTLSLVAIIVISSSNLFGQYSNVLKVSINGYGYSDETIIRFIDDATADYDGAYDAWKLMSPNLMVPAIFSRTASNYDLSINSLPFFEKDTTIEIHTRVAYSGLYTVTIEELYAFDSEYKLSITDVDGEETYEIGGTTTFSAVLQPNNSLPTFNLNISKLLTTNVALASNNNDFKLQTKGNGNYNLIFTNNSEKNIQVYDLTGKLVQQEQTSQSEYILNLENKQSGLYILNIQDDKDILTRKVYR